MNEEWFVKIKFKEDEIDVLIESLTCMDEMKSKDRHIGCGALLEFFKGIKSESDQKNKQIIPEESSRCGPNYCGECD